VDSVDPASLSFEAALERLESIVESMESGDVPLADLLTRFEEGSRLLKTCEERLRDAELRIDLLKRQKDGTNALGEFSTDRSSA
jgi:exodeoxyribonuclease VII small subunit